jgi:hypothetical protein
VTRFFRRRPSPALVLAIVALFVSLGGVATGLSGKSTVFSDDIVNNAVKSKDVRDDTLTGVDIAESTLRGVQNADHLLFATVTKVENEFAVVPERSRGAVSVSRTVRPGYFEVEFTRDVSSCTWLATAGNTEIGSDAWAATTRGPRANQPKTRLAVVVFNQNGIQVDPDALFVQVLCPS